MSATSETPSKGGIQWLPAMACMPRPTTRLQTGRSWTGCSTSVKRQSRAQSRFVRQALQIASTRIRALGGSSPDFAICASSLNGPACVALGAALDLHLDHRVVLPPLTRMLAAEGAVPSDLLVEYYSQRASADGLLIAEATTWRT